MVIDNFDIQRSGRTLWPFKANAPLIVDADGIPTFAISF
jgi:hypothetical protein